MENAVGCQQMGSDHAEAQQKMALVAQLSSAAVAQDSTVANAPME